MMVSEIKMEIAALRRDRRAALTMAKNARVSIWRLTKKVRNAEARAELLARDIEALGHKVRR